MTELLPCPFCGGEAITMSENNWWVSCTDCFAELGFEGMTDSSGCFGRFKTEAEAINAWNTRAERTCENVNNFMQSGEFGFKCSECGAYCERVTTNYCPNCGRKVIA